MTSVYLDNNATTPLHPRAREAMLPWLGGGLHGNPSSVHRFGQGAREAVEAAREEVAALINGRPPEVVFTGSGTEANNAVLFHIARQAGRRGHLVISAIEHPSIREAAARLAEEGMEVTRVSPRGTAWSRWRTSSAPCGRTRGWSPSCSPTTRWAPCSQSRRWRPFAASAGCRCSATPCRRWGRSRWTPRRWASTISFSALTSSTAPWGRRRSGCARGRSSQGYLVGGSQERRRRAGTENVPALAGLGAAATAAREEMADRSAHLAALRDRFEAALPARVPGAILHCQGSPRLPNTSHVAFSGVEGESLLIRLDLAGFAVSTGSACSSGSVEPSKTLLAMGISRQEALSSLRVSFGIANTRDQVDAFLDALAREVAELRRAVA